MIKEYKEYICDVHKGEVEEENLHRQRMPVMKDKNIIFKEIDICYECLEKVTVLKWEDVRGV